MVRIHAEPLGASKIAADMSYPLKTGEGLAAGMRRITRE